MIKKMLFISILAIMLTGCGQTTQTAQLPPPQNQPLTGMKAVQAAPAGVTRVGVITTAEFTSADIRAAFKGELDRQWLPFQQHAQATSNGKVEFVRMTDWDIRPVPCISDKGNIPIPVSDMQAAMADRGLDYIMWLEIRGTKTQEGSAFALLNVCVYDKSATDVYYNNSSTEAEFNSPVLHGVVAKALKTLSSTMVPNGTVVPAFLYDCEMAVKK